MQDERIHRRRTRESGRERRRANEGQWRRHTTNFVNFKSRGFKISKRFQYVYAVGVSQNERAHRWYAPEPVPRLSLRTFHHVHLRGRKEGEQGGLTASQSTEQACGLKGVRRERTHLDEILGIVGIEFACHCFVAE